MGADPDAKLGLKEIRYYVLAGGREVENPVRMFMGRSQGSGAVVVRLAL